MNLSHHTLPTSMSSPKRRKEVEALATSDRALKPSLSLPPTVRHVQPPYIEAKAPPLIEGQTFNSTIAKDRANMMGYANSKLREGIVASMTGKKRTAEVSSCHFPLFFTSSPTPLFECYRYHAQLELDWPNIHSTEILWARCWDGHQSATLCVLLCRIP